MATLETIRRIRVEASERGLPQLEAALERYEGTMEAIGVAMDSTDKKTQSAARAFEAMQKRVDPLHREMAQLAREFTVMARAGEQGMGLAEQARNIDLMIAKTTAAKEAAADRAKKEKEAADAAAQAAKELADAQALAAKQAVIASEQVTEALRKQRDMYRAANPPDAHLSAFRQAQLQRQQAAAAQQTALVRAASPFDTHVAAFRQQQASKAAAETDELRRSVTQLRAEFNPTAHSAELLAKQLDAIERASKKGIVSQVEAADMAERARARFDKVARDHSGKLGMTLSQNTQLAYQMNDIISGLAMGQSPLTVLTQQGGQVYQALADTPGGAGQGLKLLGSRLLGLMTPTNLVLGGLTAMSAAAIKAGYDWAAAQDEINRTMAGVARASGATTADVNRITAQGLSGGEARTSAAALAKEGVFVEQLKDATGLVKDFARITGEEAPDAAKALGAALASPTAGYDMLNKTVGIWDNSLRENIRSLQENGNLTGAQRLLIEGLSKAQRDAAESTNDWNKATKSVIVSLKDAWAWLGRDVMGPFTDNLEDSIRLQEEYVRKLGQRPSSGAMGNVWEFLGLGATKYGQELKELAEMHEELQRRSDKANDARARKFQETVDRIIGDIRRETDALLQTPMQQDIQRRQREAGVSPTSPEGDAIGRNVEALERARIGNQQMMGTQERVLNRIFAAESSNNIYARNSRSSAAGLGQFTEGTWMRLMQQYRRDLVETSSTQQLQNMRFDPAMAREMGGNLLREITEALRKANLPATEGNLHLGWFAGARGAVNVLQNPGGMAADTLGAGAARANPSLIPGRTNAELAASMEARANRVRMMAGELNQVERLDEATQNLTRTEQINNAGIQQQIALLGSSQAQQDFANKQRELRNQLDQQFVEIGPEQIRQINEQALAYAQLNEQLRNSTMSRDILFERSQIFRTQGEAAIASRLRPIFGDDQSGQAAQFYAQQIRVNQALEIGKDLAMDFGKGFVQDLRQGVDAMDALNNALDRMGGKLLDMAMDMAINQMFKGVMGAFGGAGMTGGAGMGAANIYATPAGPGFHAGGIVGREASVWRNVHPAYFDDAPRFHRGGMVAPDEVPIIARRGEGVFTPGQMAAMGQANVTINPVIENHTDSKVTTEVTRGQNGEVNIKTLIHQAAAEGASQPGNPLHRAVRTFGGGMPLTRR